ncbi:hypothetical protein Psta_4562 [Pirellula staleyi DSM 6068]|uniref:Uncharacterized protein n=1 Tax=Pirellula staleyi (strain ATCC 27377 / DSM 6068 / ICPB 4128) TaxID=530564 RepID=D2R701_PIRSD|nr:hypothetical protein [Pirellula staleyi]ADB19204.1 hypothetical protein Psta_4562 [Pirellula staleyi DSM 6068]
MYQPGDRVVYMTTKHSSHPTPRACAVQPEPHGEGYTYDVKKFWLVQDVGADGNLVVVTRRGKTRTVAATDSRLRAANWWERMFLGHRFPQPGSGSAPEKDEKSEKLMAG